MNMEFLSLAQQQGGGGGDVVAGIVGIVFFLVWLGLIVAFFAGFWKVFTKAGQPGWAAIVPIYNVYIWTKIVGRPWWFTLLVFIPLVNIVISIILCSDLAKSFGRGIGFTLGLIFLVFIFIPVLGFGSDKYIGPSAAGGAGMGA
ncbi:hypothetical protein LBMAG48_01730 [Phycisphaerae bacterium]|nr:hypothetical protein LBMAG48_01730 [Phycisphaerae bacterium]